MAEEFDLRAALKGNMKRNQQHTAPGSLLDVDLELLDITTARFVIAFRPYTDR